MSTIKHSQISALLVDDDAKLCGLRGTTLKDLGSRSTLPRTLRPGWKKPLRTNTT